jgi:hypothetical protein
LAPTTQFLDIDINPATTYDIVVPTGGFITVSWGPS